MCDSGQVINLIEASFPSLWNRDHNTCDPKTSWAPNDITYVKSLWNSLELLKLYVVFHLSEMNLPGLCCLFIGKSLLTFQNSTHISPCGLQVTYCAPQISVLSKYNKKGSWGIYFPFTSHTLIGSPWTASGYSSWHLISLHSNDPPVKLSALGLWKYPLAPKGSPSQDKPYLKSSYLGLSTMWDTHSCFTLTQWISPRFEKKKTVIDGKGDSPGQNMLWWT